MIDLITFYIFVKLSYIFLLFSFLKHLSHNSDICKINSNANLCKYLDIVMIKLLESFFKKCLLTFIAKITDLASYIIPIYLKGPFTPHAFPIFLL